MLNFFDVPEYLPAILTLCVVAGMFLLFVFEVFPTEVTAISGASILLALGLLPYETALTIFSNSAPWTIAMMFIVMAALVRTGALEAVTQFVQNQAKSNPVLAILGLLAMVIVSSAFVNNTPVVVMMIPVFVQLSSTLNTTPSKLLIPLSYCAIAGGMLTLIGSSTNLLVDGVARQNGMEPFNIFEITPIGLVIVAWVMIYLTLFGRKLLPERESMAAMMARRAKMKYFAEAAIPSDSNLIGRDVLDVQLFKREGVRLIDVVRGNESLRRNLKNVQLAVGDRVVLRTEMTELLSLQSNKNLRRMDQLSTVETKTVEVLVGPDSGLVGRRLRDVRLRRKFGVYPIAIHRRDKNVGVNLDDIAIRVGDTVLIEGSAEDLRRMVQDMELTDVSQPTERGYRRSHMPIAIVTMTSMVVLAAMNVAPILPLAIIAVAILLVTRCIDSEEAFSSVDGQLLALIFSMLAVGAALQESGAVEMISMGLAPFVIGLPPMLVILSVYLLSMTLTELVSNNAVAVVVAPIVIGLGAATGLDPRPLLVTVMVAASASFATPIGYQTNTLVYGPGGYRFSDFVKVGLPLGLSMAVICSFFIPLIWPL